MNERQTQKFKKTLIIPAVIEGIIAVIAIATVLSSTVADKWIIALCIAIGLTLLYLATVQALWMTEPIISILILGFKKPLAGIGLIFTLDLDGILWLIAVKLTLAILGAVLSFFLMAFCVALCMVIAPFSFPFALSYVKNNPDTMFL